MTDPNPKDRTSPGLVNSNLDRMYHVTAPDKPVGSGMNWFDNNEGDEDTNDAIEIDDEPTSGNGPRGDADDFSMNEDDIGAALASTSPELIKQTFRQSVITALGCLKRLSNLNEDGDHGLDTSDLELVEETYNDTFGIQWPGVVLECVDERMAISEAKFDAVLNKITFISNQVAALDTRMTKRIDGLENIVTESAKATAAALSLRPSAPVAPLPDARSGSGPANTTALGPTYNPKKSGPAPTKTVTNPMNAQHQSRLVIQIQPNGLRPEERPNDREAITEINNRLRTIPEAKDLTVVSIKWTHNGNCILCTRIDQNAADLLTHYPKFEDVLAPGRQTKATRDTKWIMIQVDGVPTGAFDRIPTLYTSATLHEELMAMNPAYGKLTIMQGPRWTRAPEEIARQRQSSIVFAVEDTEQAASLLRNDKSLSAFGRMCRIRKYADRAPRASMQCKKCLEFGHIALTCDAAPKCRLCGQGHTEQKHREECTACKEELERNGGMVTDDMGIQTTQQTRADAQYAWKAARKLIPLAVYTSVIKWGMQYTKPRNIFAMGTTV
ncbi:hypothetical protein B0H14DRAFT_2587578 [Mycena olivaceomarginata]|nr:hypothetical protein B0H14DRAFT_2587578 [Mycena olivaceomarginata]